MAYLNKHQFRTYYHGTSPHNVESIMKHGLKAHNPEEPLGEDIDENQFTGHPKGVYLGSDIETARNYGDAIFAVELPDSADWKWTESEGHVIGHDISPFFLKRVE